MNSIEEANKEALERIFRADPVWVDVRPAGEVIDGLGEGVLLHAGPPIEWERMCGPPARSRGRGDGARGLGRLPR